MKYLGEIDDQRTPGKGYRIFVGVKGKINDKYTGVEGNVNDGNCVVRGLV